MTDLVGPESLVITNQSGQDRQARGIRGRPALGPPAVGVEIEECPRARLPARAGPAQVEQLVEVPVVAVHDQHVPIAGRPGISRGAALDPERFCNGLYRNGIERKALARGVVHTIALFVIVEDHGHLGLVGAHDHERHAVDAVDDSGIEPAEIGMQTVRRANEVDEVAGTRIHRGRADIEIPPVIRGKERQRARQRTIALRKARAVLRGAAQRHHGDAGQDQSCDPPTSRASWHCTWPVSPTGELNARVVHSSGSRLEAWGLGLGAWGLGGLELGLGLGFRFRL